MKVRDEINAFSKEEDKPILLWLLSRYHWSSEWEFVARCTFEKYGTASYQSNRVWHPTVEGVAIYKQLVGYDCPECKGSKEVSTGIGMMPCPLCG